MLYRLVYIIGRERGYVDYGLTEKVVLVTGGSKGIGKATVLAFAKEGARVIFTYAHDASAASAVLRELVEFGGAGEAVRMDLTDSFTSQRCSVWVQCCAN